MAFGQEKRLVDRGYRGELIENIKRDFNIDIEVCSTPNGPKRLHAKTASVGGGTHICLAGRIPQAYT